MGKPERTTTKERQIKMKDREAEIKRDLRTRRKGETIRESEREKNVACSKTAQA